MLLSVTLVFFNDQMSQTIAEHQEEEAAFAEQVARRVGRKFHGGEEKQVWGAQVNIVGRVGQRQDYIHLIQDNPIEQLFDHIEFPFNQCFTRPPVVTVATNFESVEVIIWMPAAFSSSKKLIKPMNLMKPRSPEDEKAHKGHVAHEGKGKA